MAADADLTPVECKALASLLPSPSWLSACRWTKYEWIKICLGREWFHEHPSPLIRGTRGLVFINEMELTAFYERSSELRQAAEAG
jgi:hypothetical protein